MLVIRPGETICVALNCDKEHGPEVVDCKSQRERYALSEEFVVVASE